MNPALRGWKTTGGYNARVPWADDIRAKVDIVDVVSEYVQLKPAGHGQWKACCPLHQETKPSFSINAEKRVWYCFGCKKGGDVVKFVMEIEGLEFRDALEFLGHKYHVPDPGTPTSGRGEGRLRAEGREALFRSHESAAAYYHNILENTSMGEPARRYLEKRGIAKVTRAKFQLGATSTGWDELSAELLKKGARESDLLAGGLSLRKRDGTGVVDRFRGRLMFPVKNASGRVVAFGARALGDEDPKYLNSSSSPIYNKSEALFWLSDAKRAIAAKGYVVLVEGYMDVISLVQAGVENVIATCGTAMTEEHLKVLFRYTKDIVVAFDGDNAGREAAVRTAAIVIAAGALPRVAAFPAGVDPDDFVRKEGAKALDSLIEAAPDPVTFVLDTVGAAATGSARDKEKWIERVAPLVREAGSLIRPGFIQTISGRMAIPPDAADSLIGKGPSGMKERDSKSAKSLLSDPRLRIEAAVLAGILRRPDNFGASKELIGPADFQNPAALAVYKIFDAQQDPALWDTEILARAAEMPGLSELYGLLTDESLFPHQEDFSRRVARLRSLEASASASQIERELALAETAGDWEKVMELAKKRSEFRQTGKDRDGE